MHAFFLIPDSKLATVSSTSVVLNAGKNTRLAIKLSFVQLMPEYKTTLNVDTSCGDAVQWRVN